MGETDPASPHLLGENTMNDISHSPAINHCRHPPPADGAATSSPRLDHPSSPDRTPQPIAHTRTSKAKP